MVEHVQTTAATMGTKMTIGGGATAVIFGVAFNQVEIQLLGVLVGSIGVIGGLIINAVARYLERKDRIQVMLKSGEWDGIERRKNGTR